MNLLPFLRRSLPFVLSLVAINRATAFTIELACAKTPALALRISQAAANEAMPETNEGYRITTVRWDPLLNQRWAMIASCGHPERPAIAMLLPGPKTQNTLISSQVSAQRMQSPFPVVHAGDLVQLWSQEENLRIQAAGRAEENGAIGKKVRVRLIHSGFDIGQDQTFIGTVRGPGDVEIQR